MGAKFYIKTFNNIARYRLFIWPIVLIISFAGFFYPKMGLAIFPMFLVIMIMGFFKGRHWCGNYCPRGAFLDIPVRKIGNFDKINKLFKTKTFRIAVLILLMSLFMRNVILSFGHTGQSEFWDKLGMAGVMMCTITTSFGLILALTVNPRSWCTFCPMGTVQKFLHSVKNKVLKFKGFNTKVTLTNEYLCLKCGNCTRVCPMQISVHQELKNSTNQVQNPDCIKCKTCVVNCKAGILKMEKEHTTGFTVSSVPESGYENRRTYRAKIESIYRISDEIIEFTFQLNDKIEYRSGQFVSILADKENEIFRAYSISKPDDDNTKIRITVKLDNKGYATEKIFALKEGDTLILEGPMGDFTLKNNNSDKYFIAGGIGITPFLTLVKDALTENNRKNKVHLLYGGNTRTDLIYDKYFIELEKQHNNFYYTKSIAKEIPEDSNKFKKGYVTDLIDSISFNDAEVYLCGPKPMIDKAVEKLYAKGVDRDKVYIDMF